MYMKILQWFFLVSRPPTRLRTPKLIKPPPPRKIPSTNPQTEEGTNFKKKRKIQTLVKFMTLNLILDFDSLFHAN